MLKLLEELNFICTNPNTVASFWRLTTTTHITAGRAYRITTRIYWNIKPSTKPKHESVVCIWQSSSLLFWATKPIRISICRELYQINPSILGLQFNFFKREMLNDVFLYEASFVGLVISNLQASFQRHISWFSWPVRRVLSVFKSFTSVPKDFNPCTMLVSTFVPNLFSFKFCHLKNMSKGNWRVGECYESQEKQLFTYFIL